MHKQQSGLLFYSWWLIRATSKKPIVARLRQKIAVSGSTSTPCWKLQIPEENRLIAVWK